MRNPLRSIGRSPRHPRRRRSASALLAALMAVLLVATACGSDDSGTSTSPDPVANADALGPVAQATGAPVKIGVISDGQSAAIDNSIQFDVAEATASYLNERRSGIGGRPIELVECETLADPAKGADCANQMIEEDVVAVTVAESGVAESIWQPLADANIPVMFFAAGSPALLADTESTFTLSDPMFSVLQLPIDLSKDKGIRKVTAVVIDVPAALDIQQNLAPKVFEDAGLDYELVRVPPGTADMTPQMQSAVDGDPGLVFVVGNDSFCISAFNGLKAVGYDGQISAISQCITDATRKAVPSDVLAEMVVAALAPAGGTDPSAVLYQAAMKTYGKNIDIGSTTGRSMFMTLAGLQAALQDISGEITPKTVIAAIKAMPETELPGAAGLRFRCNGKANPEAPAVCVRGGLSTTLDGQGQPTGFEVRGTTPIPD
ncbi:ABC transporter substrate-binding protein [Parafrankia discariae]|uniref:ABC transporter substrate-binding protein n=1 Tax=Parafrankia discariae TaxID=365528 RepID=UPI000475AE60|nr:ABC transporter substrate-binding protein [Parafrankia discariae]